MRIKESESIFKDLIKFKEILGISRFSSVGEFLNFDVKIVNSVRTRINDQQISSTQGCSKTLKGAVSNSILEAIERYCAANISEEYLYKSYYKKNDNKYFDINKLFYQSVNGQYYWIDARSLFHPYKLIKLPLKEVAFPFVLKDDSIDINASTSGLACGSTQEEAIIYAILELVERNALSKFQLFWDKRELGVVVKLNEIKEVSIVKLLYELISKEYKVSIIKLHALFPTYFVTIFDSTNMGPKFSVAGCATSITDMPALKRAIYEALQGLVVSMQSVREDLDRHTYLYEKSLFKAEEEFYGFHSILKNLNNNLPLSLSTLNFTSQKNCLDYILKTLKKSGFNEAFCVDLSNSIFPVKTAKVIVPGIYDFKINKNRIKDVIFY